MLHNKKPFFDRKFYLDLKFCHRQDADNLVKDVKKLGGKIESFLSKDVTHVITDRHNLKLKAETWTPMTPNSHATILSPMNTNDSALNHFDTPTNTSSSPVDSKIQALSRGLSLVQKAKQKKQGTTDILEVCNQWGIKVVHLHKVLAFISKYKQLHGKKIEKEECKKTTLKKDYQAQKLEPPFIKVEDTERKYRPYYKTFASWKDSIDTSLLCNVSKVLKEFQSIKTSEKNFKENCHPNIKTQSSNFNQGLQCYNGFSFPGNYASVLGYHQFTSNVSAVLPLKPQVSSIKHNLNKSCSKQKKSMKSFDNEGKKKLKKKYCEICSCSYYELDKHLLTDLHKKFLSDTQNFSTLQNVISTLPSISSFLDSQSFVEYQDEPLELTTHTRKSADNLSFKDENCAYKIDRDSSIVNSDECVSASCSTEILSNIFPYLEDTLDGVKVPEELQTNVSYQNISLCV